MPAYGYVYHMYAYTHGGQISVSDPLALKFQAIISGPTWVLGSELDYLQQQ